MAHGTGILTPKTAKPESGVWSHIGSGIDFDAEFSLDLRVIEAAHPIGKLLCDTSDGCGSTCSGSACNSNANNPS